MRNWTTRRWQWWNNPYTPTPDNPQPEPRRLIHPPRRFAPVAGRASPDRRGFVPLAGRSRVSGLWPTDAVEALRANPRLWVGELVLSGRTFGDAAQHRPVAYRQRQVCSGERGKGCASDVRECELEGAVGQNLGGGRRDRVNLRQLHFDDLIGPAVLSEVRAATHGIEDRRAQGNLTEGKKAVAVGGCVIARNAVGWIRDARATLQ